MKHIIISLFATFSAFAAPALAHEGEGHVQLVYKHAISTVMPSSAVSVDE
ncbi:MAG: hypothetical protein EBV03_08865 [Proteobacteria bacterium]|nr:hypothetical protein [Pseudomonadota bacterium]